MLDGTGARRTLPVDAGTEIAAHRSHVTVSTVAIGTTVAEGAVLAPGAGVAPTSDLPVGSVAEQSAGEQLRFGEDAHGRVNRNLNLAFRGFAGDDLASEFFDMNRLELNLLFHQAGFGKG